MNGVSYVEFIYGSDINKGVPGPWHDPPTKEQVEEMLKVGFGALDRSDFHIPSCYLLPCAHPEADTKWIVLP